MRIRNAKRPSTRRAPVHPDVIGARTSVRRVLIWASALEFSNAVGLPTVLRDESRAPPRGRANHIGMRGRRTTWCDCNLCRAIDPLNQAAVTLQEHNHIAIVDLVKGRILKDFTAGTTSHPSDLKDDDRVRFCDKLLSPA